MKFSARVIVFLSFLFLFLLFKITPVFAQTTPQQPQNLPAQAGLHNYTQNVMIEVMSSLGCVIAGVDAVDPNQKCLGIANGKIGPVDSHGGAIGAMGNLIAMTYSNPIHSTDFVRYMAGNFGITKNAYAANDGFQQLSPLIKIWSVFRDITYLLFVLVFLIIGFGIMLRVHIDPRTVMTIENQIPKIIIGLILVTFSFAIIGLMIDLMWILTYLSINVFMNIPGFDSSRIAQATQHISGENAIGAFNNFVGFQDVVTQSAGAVKDIVQHLLGTSASIDTSNGNIIGAIFGFLVDTVKNLVGGVIGWVAGTLALLVIGIAVLFSLFRLWFTLIKAYVMILIVAVFSPFWILAGILPGSKLTFENLLREIGSNLITFPATIIMFLLGKTFMDIFGSTSGGFVPPLIGNPGDTRAIGAIAGLGIILLAPDINKIMRKALKAPDFDFSAISAAVGIGAGAVTSAPGEAIKFGRSLSAARFARGGLWGRIKAFEAEQRLPGAGEQHR